MIQLVWWDEADNLNPDALALALRIISRQDWQGGVISTTKVGPDRYPVARVETPPSSLPLEVP